MDLEINIHTLNCQALSGSIPLCELISAVRDGSMLISNFHIPGNIR